MPLETASKAPPVHNISNQTASQSTTGLATTPLTGLNRASSSTRQPAVNNTDNRKALRHNFRCLKSIITGNAGESLCEKAKLIADDARLPEQTKQSFLADFMDRLHALIAHTAPSMRSQKAEAISRFLSQKTNPNELVSVVSDLCFVASITPTAQAPLPPATRSMIEQDRQAYLEQRTAERSAKMGTLSQSGKKAAPKTDQTNTTSRSTQKRAPLEAGGIMHPAAASRKRAKYNVTNNTPALTQSSSATSRTVEIAPQKSPAILMPGQFVKARWNATPHRLDSDYLVDEHNQPKWESGWVLHAFTPSSDTSGLGEKLGTEHHTSLKIFQALKKSQGNLNEQFYWVVFDDHSAAPVKTEAITLADASTAAENFSYENAKNWTDLDIPERLMPYDPPIQAASINDAIKRLSPEDETTEQARTQLMGKNKKSVFAQFDDYPSMNKTAMNNELINMCRDHIDGEIRLLALDGVAQRTTRAFRKQLGDRVGAIITPQLNSKEASQMNKKLSTIFKGSVSDFINRPSNNTAKNRTNTEPNVYYLDYLAGPQGNEQTGVFPFSDIDDLLRSTQQQKLTLSVTFSLRGNMDIPEWYVANSKTTGETENPIDKAVPAITDQLSALFGIHKFRVADHSATQYRRKTNSLNMITYHFNLEKDNTPGVFQDSYELLLSCKKEVKKSHLDTSRALPSQQKSRTTTTDECYWGFDPRYTSSWQGKRSG